MANHGREFSDLSILRGPVASRRCPVLAMRCGAYRARRAICRARKGDEGQRRRFDRGRGGADGGGAEFGEHRGAICDMRDGPVEHSAMRHDFRYTLVMLAAVVVMSLLLRRWQARLPLAWWEKLAIGVGGFCGAMIGAKLPFVLSDWAGLVSGTAWLSDGKTIMCGIVGGYLGVELA